MHSLSAPELATQRQRAQTFARSNMIFAVAMLLIAGVGDLLASGSYIYLVLTVATLLAFMAYSWAIRRFDVNVATLLLALVLEVIIAAAIFNSGGILTSAVTLFSALILGVGLVLVDRRPILLVTVISTLVYLGMTALQLADLIVPVAPGAIMDENTSTAYKVFAVALQVALIGLVGFVTSTLADSMRRRTAALEGAQADASEHARSAERFAAQLNDKVAALRVTEELLRSTVDRLSVPVLPLREGAVVMPLIGHIDEERAGRLTHSLLGDIYTRRSQLAIIDLTGIGDTSDTLATMLLRMASGARLLGAELVVAGLQPGVARMLTTRGGEKLTLRSYPSLEQAIDDALSRPQQELA